MLNKLPFNSNWFPAQDSPATSLKQKKQLLLDFVKNSNLPPFPELHDVLYDPSNGIVLPLFPCRKDRMLFFDSGEYSEISYILNERTLDSTKMTLDILLEKTKKNPGVFRSYVYYSPKSDSLTFYLKGDADYSKVIFPGVTLFLSLEDHSFVGIWIEGIKEINKCYYKYFTLSWLIGSVLFAAKRDKLPNLDDFEKIYTDEIKDYIEKNHPEDLRKIMLTSCFSQEVSFDEIEKIEQPLSFYLANYFTKYKKTIDISSMIPAIRIAKAFSLIDFGGDSIEANLLLEQETYLETTKPAFTKKADKVVAYATKLAAKSKSWRDFSDKMFDNNGYVEEKFGGYELERFYFSKQYEQIDLLLVELIKKFGLA